MVKRRSSVKGDFKLRKILRNLPENVESDVKPAMQKAANMVLELQRELIPRDTGAAAAALEAFVSKSGLDAQIGIRGRRNSNKFFYLKFVEYGTKGHKGVLRADGRKRSTKNQTNGSVWFGKYPDIPARPAHPFLRPSFDMNRTKIIATIKAAIDSTLKKAAGMPDDE